MQISEPGGIDMMSARWVSSGQWAIVYDRFDSNFARGRVWKSTLGAGDVFGAP